MWTEDLRRARKAPFSTGRETLWIAFYASAEWGCFDVLGWPKPQSSLDLFAEHRRETNGVELKGPRPNNLLSALRYRGLPTADAEHKEAMQAIASRGAPFTDAERAELLEYCAGDVATLFHLFRAIAAQHNRGGSRALPCAPAGRLGRAHPGRRRRDAGGD
jgi:hypothetical protein